MTATRRAVARAITRSARHGASLALLATALLLGACATGRPDVPVSVKVLAINDFHGNLKPPLGGIRLPDPTDPGKLVSVSAGGAEHLATAVREARAKNANHIFVAAGDLVGATPLLSALFHDEPTIESLSRMGLEVSAVGNHEFDQGRTELLRLQQGGCHASTGCQGPRPYTGAGFQYLAASTVDTRTGRTLLPPYHVRRFQGIPVAFIGLTLAATPSIVVPSGVAGLEFRDEVQTVNALVPELRRQGIEAIVVLIHEGGLPSGGINECPGISGPIVDIVKGFDRAVDLVISGHTHRAYTCRIDGRLVTSADKYGTLLTEIDLQLDPRSGDVIEARAENLVVRTDRYAKDAEQSALIADYERLAAPLAQRPVGRLLAPFSRDETAAGESPLGRLVADAHWLATRAAADGGARLAFTNPGGLRAALVPRADGSVRYEDLFAVQPFSNNLVTLTLNGAELRELLEQQWLGQTRARILQVSSSFSYRWDGRRPPGQRVAADSLRLDGRPVGPDEPVRLTVNNFLADGGDGFTVLKRGRDRRTGPMDLDALETLLRSAPTGIAPATQERILREP